MKKLFFAIAALAVMTGCNNDELVEVTPKQAIAFGNAFVDNATRAIDPSITSETISSFNVYGTVQGTGIGEGTVNIGAIRNGQYYDLKEVIDQDKEAYKESLVVKIFIEPPPDDPPLYN